MPEGGGIALNIRPDSLVNLEFAALFLTAVPLLSLVADFSYSHTGLSPITVFLAFNIFLNLFAGIFLLRRALQPFHASPGIGEVFP